MIVAGVVLVALLVVVLLIIAGVRGHQDTLGTYAARANAEMHARRIENNWHIKSAKAEINANLRLVEHELDKME